MTLSRVLFLIILLVKLSLMILINSPYQSNLFIPFIKEFLLGHNPYNIAYKYGEIHKFYYAPAILLYQGIFLYLPSLLQNSYLLNLFYKLGILCADISIFLYLKRIVKNKFLELVIFYWASPLIIYPFYVELHLDIVTIFFLVTALYYISANKDFYGGILLGLAVCSRLSILLLVPIILIFCLKNKALKQGLILFSSFSLTFASILFPFLNSIGFREMVLFNKVQTLIFENYYFISEQRVYLSFLVMLLLYITLLMYARINKDLLYVAVSILFSMLFLTVRPMSNWFAWIAPFVAIYFSKDGIDKKRKYLFYLLFCISYLFYFIFCSFNAQFPDYPKFYFLGMPIKTFIDNSMVQNMGLTLLAGFMMALTIMQIRFAHRSNMFFSVNKNLFIGIAGDSASGKTTLAGLIKNLLGDELVLKLEGDGDHKYERDDPSWKDVTHLNPKANYLHRQHDHVERLKKGQLISRTEYDHMTGKFKTSNRIKPRLVNIVSGLHSFYLPKMRKDLDIKIYLEPDENLRQYWKISRDLKERNYTAEGVSAQIKRRENDSDRFIKPQKNYADMIIKLSPADELYHTRERNGGRLKLKILFPSSINIDLIIDNLNRCPNLFLKHEYSNDLNFQIIEFDGEISSRELNEIITRTVSNITDIVNRPIIFNADHNGLIQMFVLAAILENLKSEL